ncbi:helix-turn-helix domain-containing protein [Pseudonocardia sp. Cha107L01]|uniref:helix-turn-helix domain-containing protein n=1 Tax=Pseudonocardia sp. Cha107L01 TaxID=3457576 RepID=UPI00403E7D77
MTSAAEQVPDPSDFAVGARVREIRQRNGQSLRALASALGISASALSQIETGRTRPSIQRVHEIATELNIPLSALFAPVLETPQTDAAHGLSSSVSYDSSICVQKAVEAPTIQLENGIRWDRISPRESDGLSFLHLVFEPKAGYSEYLRHNGREIVYVIEGTLTFHVGFTAREVSEGDSFMFPSTTPHKVVNPTEHRARACWLVLT